MVVNINMYQHSPRMAINIISEIPEPQVGDTMIIPIGWVRQMSKEYREKWYEFDFRVVKREINCCYYEGPILSIELEMTEKINN